LRTTVDSLGLVIQFPWSIFRTLYHAIYGDDETLRARFGFVDAIRRASIVNRSTKHGTSCVDNIGHTVRTPEMVRGNSRYIARREEDGTETLQRQLCSRWTSLWALSKVG
jgi:hypothetical protein